MNEPVTTSPPSGALPRLSEVAKQASALAALAIAAGYVSRRAHLNYLGVPAQSSLGVERYLMAAWGMAGDLAARILPLGGALLLAGGLVQALRFVSAAVRRKRSPPPASAHLAPWQESVLLWALVTTLGLAIPFVYWPPLHLHDVLTGSLVAAKLAKPDPLRWDLAVSAWVMTAWLTHRLSTWNASRPAASRGALAVRLLPPLAVVQLVGLVALHGVLLESTFYSRVRAHMRDGPPPLAGFLLHQGSERIVLWTTGCGTGHMTELSDSDITRIDFLEREDVLAVARAAIGATQGCKTTR